MNFFAIISAHQVLLYTPEPSAFTYDSGLDVPLDADKLITPIRDITILSHFASISYGVNRGRAYTVTSNILYGTAPTEEIEGTYSLDSGLEYVVM